MNGVNDNSRLQFSLKYILYISIIYTSTGLLYSCDSWYDIPLTNESETLSISSNCGAIDFRLGNFQGGPFYFWQDYNLTDTVFLYKDSIEVYYKNQKYSCFYVGIKDEPNPLVISDSGTLRFGFHIADHHNQIMENDTLTIIFGGFIYCESQKISVDTLTLVMREDLKGPDLNPFN